MDPATKKDPVKVAINNCLDQEIRRLYIELLKDELHLREECIETPQENWGDPREQRALEGHEGPTRSLREKSLSLF